MPRAELRISENFIGDLSQIYSNQVLQRIKAALSMLEGNPEIGSPLARASLIEAFGENIRTYAISTFVLVYRFDGVHIDILALVDGAPVKLGADGTNLDPHAVSSPYEKRRVCPQR